MFKVYSDTKFYVYCPAGHATGGAELLHQIVSLLRDNGKEAFVVLTGDEEHVVHNEYKKYNIVTAEGIEDNSHNIEILYEPEFYRALLPTKTQKILWWLSVDNLFSSGRRFLAVRDIARFYWKDACKIFVDRLYHKLLVRDNKYGKIISIKGLSKLDVTNAYQSEYAQYYLLNNGFKEIFPLKDFINTEHIGKFSVKNRENIVLYNPKKGFDFTKKLIKYSPNIKWVPIVNMTRQQVIELMNKAKVYVDFGFHPGKDRLPRECAMNGLCVITGNRGSARYFEDVWIENKYKFDEKKASRHEIIDRIKETMINYESCVTDFSLYRYRISLEKEEFEREVKEFFVDCI